MRDGIELDGRDALSQPDRQDAAWEEVETGRYMPRRVRGSCRGRALG
jgi:hypothetical protein